MQDLQPLRVLTIYRPIEEDILKTIAYFERSYGKATAKAIAGELNLSVSQIRRYLNHMEKAGRVHRIGVRGGWRRIA